jgi:hypothetical protein
MGFNWANDVLKLLRLEKPYEREVQNLWKEAV